MFLSGSSSRLQPQSAAQDSFGKWVGQHSHDLAVPYPPQFTDGIPVFCEN